MNKIILITGAGGTVGLLLTQYYLENDYIVYTFDRSEDAVARLLNLQHEHENGFRLHVKFGDMLNIDFLESIFDRVHVNYVIHCAALKHVSVSATFPQIVLDENIRSFKNLIKVVKKNKSVRKIILCSSDKASIPLSAMAKSKRIIEKLSEAKIDDTELINVRFGNILYSSGSILQKLEYHIKENRPFFIRNNKMTRYVLTKLDVIALINYALEKDVQGDIIVMKAPAIKISNLIVEYLKMRHSEIPIITKAGNFTEAIHESLFHIAEVEHVQARDNYFIYNKNQQQELTAEEKSFVLSSENALNPEANKKIYE